MRVWLRARWARVSKWWRQWRARRWREKLSAWMAAAAAERAKAPAKEDDKGGPGLVAAILPVLGASAGLVALATLAGGAMLWLRFDALGLPADRAVALVPREVLVVIGARALLIPTLVGAAALVLLLLFAPFKPNGDTNWRFWLWFALAAIGVGIAVKLLVEGRNVIETVTVIGLGVLSLVIILATAVRVKHLRYVAVAVFSTCAVFGAALAVVETQADPRMEPIAIVLEPAAGAEPPAPNGRAPARRSQRLRGIAGFLVSETSDRLIFVSLPGNGDPGDAFADWPVDRVVSIPRSEIARIAIREPVGTSAGGGGRDQAHTMLADLQQSMRRRTTGAAGPVHTLDPAVAFAPLVHLHSRDEARPMSARGFIDNSRLMWANRPGCQHRPIAAGRSLDEPGSATIEDARLGSSDTGVARPYSRAPEGAACNALAVRFSATDRTRAFDGDRPTRPDAAGARVTLGRSEGFYLDLDEEALDGSSDVDDAGGQVLLRNVPAYYELHPTEHDGSKSVGKRRYERLTYWFLYGLSVPPPSRPRGLSHLISHEGDWERVSVLLLHEKGTDVYQPVSVRYHFHDDHRDVPWDAARRSIGESGALDQPTHPVVYSARGSHASYPRSGRMPTPYAPKGKEYFVVDDDAIACPDCPQWQTWRLLVEATSQQWYGFGGAWGAVRNQGFRTGPLGPSTYKLGAGEGPPTTSAIDRMPAPTAPPELREQSAGES